jgi:hypothetical protein
MAMNPATATAPSNLVLFMTISLVVSAASDRSPLGGSPVVLAVHGGGAFA